MILKKALKNNKGEANEIILVAIFIILMLAINIATIFSACENKKESNEESIERGYGFVQDFNSTNGVEDTGDN